MDSKIIAIFVVIVIVVAAGAYYLGTMSTPTRNTTVSTNNTTGNATNHQNHDINKHKNTTKKNETPAVKISASKAQEIAIGSARELGGEDDIAGTPTLFKWTQNKLHTWAWHVPLYDAKTKKSAGALDIDAMTGAVIMNE